MSDASHCRRPSRTRWRTGSWLPSCAAVGDRGLSRAVGVSVMSSAVLCVVRGQSGDGGDRVRAARVIEGREKSRLTGSPAQRAIRSDMCECPRSPPSSPPCAHKCAPCAPSTLSIVYCVAASACFDADRADRSALLFHRRTSAAVLGAVHRFLALCVAAISVPRSRRPPYMSPAVSPVTTVPSWKNAIE